jgi:hypothetical protein
MRSPNHLFVFLSYSASRLHFCHGFWTKLSQDHCLRNTWQNSGWVVHYTHYLKNGISHQVMVLDQIWTLFFLFDKFRMTDCWFHWWCVANIPCPQSSAWKWIGLDWMERKWIGLDKWSKHDSVDDYIVNLKRCDHWNWAHEALQM